MHILGRLVAALVVVATCVSCHTVSMHLGTTNLGTIPANTRKYAHPVFEASYNTTGPCATTATVTSYISSVQRIVEITHGSPRVCTIIPIQRTDPSKKFHSTKLCIETIRC